MHLQTPKEYCIFSYEENIFDIMKILGADNRTQFKSSIPDHARDPLDLFIDLRIPTIPAIKRWSLNHLSIGLG